MKDSSKIIDYPKTDGVREYYVQWPVQVTEHDLDIIPFAVGVNVGEWVAVDVLPLGFKHMLAPIGHATFEACKKNCDRHNRFHGWGEAEATFIVGESMGLIDNGDQPTAESNG